MSKAPELWAVYDPEGRLMFDGISPSRDFSIAAALWRSGIKKEARLNKLGYVCRRVKVVPVGDGDE